MKKLEGELFYHQAVKIFGDKEDDEDDVSDERTGQKSVTFRDFRLLFTDGDETYATARRGEYYMLFFYLTT